MPRLLPVSWNKFIKRLRQFGFEGPCQEGKHPYMIKNNFVLTVPNPHDGDISVALLIRILRQAEIDREAWQKRKK